MTRKRPALAEPVSSSRSRVTRRSTTGAPSSKKKRSPEPESDADSEDDYDGPSTSQTKKLKRGNSSTNRGKAANKTKRGSFQVKQEIMDDDENEEKIDGEVENGITSREHSPDPSTFKKTAKLQTKKKKKKESPPETPPTSPSPSPSRSVSPSTTKSDISSKKGRKAVVNSVSKVKIEKESTPVKTNGRNLPPKRKKKPVEEETAEEIKLRERAERKARRIEEAKNRPKLTIEQKLAKLRKKKERRERRKEQEKEESMRQKYGQRKIKAEASKWNFGPISSINQRRRDEMMAYFPKANFLAEDGVPKVMNNFRRATVKYNMEVLNPFITCGICDVSF